MPARLVVPAPVPVAELERRYRQARDPVARSHYQIIWLLAAGATPAESSTSSCASRQECLGWSPSR